MSYDFGKAAMLLHVCDKAKGWPELRPLHDTAMQELRQMQVNEKPEQVKAPEPVFVPETKPELVPDPIDRRA